MQPTTTIRTTLDMPVATCDVVVAGGGLTGVCAAIAAARVIRERLSNVRHVNYRYIQERLREEGGFMPPLNEESTSSALTGQDP